MSYLTALGPEATGCNRCGARVEGRPNIHIAYSPVSTPVQGGILIVGEHPCKEATLQGRNYTGEQYAALRDLLGKHARFHPAQVIETFAVKCLGKSQARPTPEQVQHCMYRLLLEIKTYRPALIIAMGNMASTVFTGETSGIKDRRGTAMIWNYPAMDPSENFSCIVAFTSSIYAFEVKKASAKAKDESTVRDERVLMQEDFRWIGYLARNTAMVNMREWAKTQEGYFEHHVKMETTHAKEAYESIFNYLEGFPALAVDTETVNVEDKRALCVSISPAPGISVVIPVLQALVRNPEKALIESKWIERDASGAVVSNRMYKNGDPSLALLARGKKWATMPDYWGESFYVQDDDVRDYIWERLNKILVNPAISKIMHNGAFDYFVFLELGIQAQGWAHDTMHIYSLLNEEGVRNLKALSDIYIPRLRGYDLPFVEARKELSAEKYWIKVPYDRMHDYAACDADATMTLYHLLYPELQKDPQSLYIYDLAMQFQRIASEMQRRGTHVDRALMDKLFAQNVEELRALAITIIDGVKLASGRRWKALSLDNIDPETGSMDKPTDASPGFKIQGNKDVANYLIASGVKLTEKTATFAYKQDDDVLANLVTHPVVGPTVKAILAYRKLTKLNTFYVSYYEAMDANDVVHPQLNIHGTVTGRNSMSSPNLQQTPKDSRVKNVIVAPPGYHIVQMDLSQAELRILAHYANETSMKAVFAGTKMHVRGVHGAYLYIDPMPADDLKYFFEFTNTRTGQVCAFDTVEGRPDLLLILGEAHVDEKTRTPEDFKLPNKHAVTPLTTLPEGWFAPGDVLDTGSGDIHCFVASEINGCKVWKVSSKQRSEAKTVSFGIPYGAVAQTIAFQQKIKVEEAERLLNLYFGKFPKVKQYIDSTVAEARQYGMIRTVLGRPRHLGDIHSGNRKRASHAERQAVNFKIQATCHDFICNHVVAIDAELKRRGMRTYLFNTVHDSLLYYSPTDEVWDFVTWLKPLAETSYIESDVKFTADVEVYDHNWGGKKLHRG
jgi:uracil-DNA glycosylase family 4